MNNNNKRNTKGEGGGREPCGSSLQCLWRKAASHTAAHRSQCVQQNLSRSGFEQFRVFCLQTQSAVDRLPLGQRASHNHKPLSTSHLSSPPPPPSPPTLAPDPHLPLLSQQSINRDFPQPPFNEILAKQNMRTA